MEHYDLTLRFDNEDHSLTAKNGLPIEKLAELLLSLSKCVSADDKNPLTLSEIRGNCYAIQISTPVFTLYENLKVVHKKISENDFSGLNNDQKKYAIKLKSILGNKLSLTAYDNDKNFNVEVSEIVLPVQPDYFYEIGSVYGIITSIGGSAIDGKTVIHVNRVPYDIEISTQHESELLQYYKKDRMRFLVRKKITTEKKEIVSAKLEHFEVSPKKEFVNTVEDIRNNLSEDFFNDLNSNYYNSDLIEL
jgi:hypothetical protein